MIDVKQRAILMLESLSADMARLPCDDPDQGDVTIRVKDEDIRCHMVFLTARSVYFRSMVLSGLDETRTRNINIPDISPDNFRKAL